MHVNKTLWKRVALRENAQIPVSYVQLHVSTKPPLTTEFRYDAICKGGDFAKDIFSGADIQNYKAEKAAYLAKVNQAFE